MPSFPSGELNLATVALYGAISGKAIRRLARRQRYLPSSPLHRMLTPLVRPG